MGRKKPIKKKWLISFFLFFLFIASIGILILQGMIIPNSFFSRDYEVKGVDVSSYQGEINWKQIETQNIQFAFIKATEGSSFVDSYFTSNWNNAKTTKIRIGAYHFFSYDSAGTTQAENFIDTVPKEADTLPPVIDVEFYGDKEKNLPSKEDVRKELQDMIDILEKHYGKRVILYTTNKAYDLYIKEEFEDTDIWIRDVWTKPTLPDQRDWTFWQYTDKEKLEGYNGEEEFIDVNVFHGSLEEFILYGR
ncbi:glycoside hydrolase family 25 protein [Bacillus sp. B1-b2]|nr:glycoside hydrolase family 25 protein [Bacillus sp. B1-b2]